MVLLGLDDGGLRDPSAVATTVKPKEGLLVLIELYEDVLEDDDVPDDTDDPPARRPARVVLVGGVGKGMVLLSSGRLGGGRMSFAGGGVGARS